MMAQRHCWIFGVFVLIGSTNALLKDDSYKQELLDAMNAKRAEFGFADKFKLAESDTDDARKIRQSFKDTLKGTLENEDTPRKLKLQRFDKSGPLYFQAGYFNFPDVADPGKALKADTLVEIWSRRYSPSKTIHAADDMSIFFGSYLRTTMLMADGLWPFVTPSADQNVIIERGVPSQHIDFIFIVLFPDYDNAKVPPERRNAYAKSKTLERCLKRKTPEYQTNLRKFMCDAKNLDKKSSYQKYKEGIKEFTKCVHETLFEGFRLGLDAREHFVKTICENDDIFKTKSGILNSFPFREALDADKNISPFAVFKTI